MNPSGDLQELDVRLTRQLGDRVHLFGFIYPLLLLAAGWQTSVPIDHPLLFCSGSLLTLAGAIWLTLASRKASAATTGTALARREEIRVSALLLASIWSLLSGFGLQAYPANDFSIFLVLAILAWIGIAAAVLSPDRRLAHIFIHLHILPAIIWAYHVRERFGLSLMVLLALLWAAFYFVTERHATEARHLLLTTIQLESQAAQLQQSRDQAEEASRIRTRFLATISHQIRTPLNGILGVNGLLRDSQLDSQQIELVSIIHHSAERLHHLVNNLVDLSQIDAGKLALAPIEFDLRHLIEDLSLPLRGAAEAKGITWSLRIRREVPPSCFGDPLRLKQVLEILLRNALKFTNHGGITIEVGMADGGHVRCVVEDTGNGIPPEKIHALFDEFKTGSEETLPSPDGAGLSLAVSRKLIGLMGGRIGVQSAPGQGSHFWFEIPVTISTSETRS
jgi:signal transduction histidine kinase